MQQALKQRLIGAVVLLSLAVIFLPMLLEGPVERTRVDVPIEVPPRPAVPGDEALPPPGFAERPSPGAAFDDVPRPVPGQTTPDPRPPDSGPTADPSGAGTPAAPVVEPGDEETVASSPDAASAGDGEAADSGIAVAEPTSDAGPGSWAVQVGAFGRQGNAVGLRNRLREAGLPVYVDRTDDDGQSLYRVRVGPVADRGKAESLARRLKGERDLSALVVPH